MSTWDTEIAQALTAPDEVRLATVRRDGSRRTPRIIWDVAVGDRVFIRSTNGRGADWFRWAIAIGRGRLETGHAAHEVVFVEAKESDLASVDTAYRQKYGRYASIVGHLLTPGPRAATLEVLPA
ncbi:MAG: DUF2255 family protein [Tetrasphaera sp.]